jgi:internalin A
MLRCIGPVVVACLVGLVPAVARGEGVPDVAQVLERIVKEGGKVIYNNEKEVTGVEGTLSLEDFAAMSKLTKIEYLFPTNGQVTDKMMEYVKGWVNLRDLRVKGPQFTDEGLKNVAGLTRLTRLSIPYSPGITDKGLAYLKDLKLELLSIADDSITDAGLFHLKDMTGMTCLKAGSFGGKITDAGLKHLSGMTKLNELWLIKSDVTDAGILENLQGLTRLEQFRAFGSSKVTSRCLQAFPEVNAIWLSGKQITDADLKVLAGMPKLVFVSLTDTGVTDAGVEEYKKLAPKVKLTVK